MKLAIWCSPDPFYLKLARQMGVTDIVSGPPPPTVEPVYSLEAFLRIRRIVESFGLKLSVIESIPIGDEIKLGLLGRDRAIDNFCRSLRNMGTAGIPILCYNWMAVLPVIRTSFSTRLRGGALSISYDWPNTCGGGCWPSAI